MPSRRRRQLGGDADARHRRSGRGTRRRAGPSVRTRRQERVCMNDAGTVKTVCMDADEIERSLTRIAHQILETNKGAGNIALVGIVTRGDLLAKRLAEKIEAIEGTKVPLGKLDISFYRDDFATHLSPEVHSTDILFDLDGKDVVLVDDLPHHPRRARRAHGHRPSLHGAAGRPRGPRPSSAAHPRRLRGQERPVFLRRERAPVLGRGGRQVRGRDTGNRSVLPRGFGTAGR